MRVPVHFYSYFKGLAGADQTDLEIPDGTTVTALLKELFARHPKLAAMERSMLVAVGVDYQSRDYILRPGDEVSLFPPVQGG